MSKHCFSASFEVEGGGSTCKCWRFICKPKNANYISYLSFFSPNATQSFTVQSPSVGQPAPGAITCNAKATAFNGRDTIPIIRVQCNPTGKLVTTTKAPTTTAPKTCASCTATTPPITIVNTTANAGLFTASFEVEGSGSVCKCWRFICTPKNSTYSAALTFTSSTASDSFTVQSGVGSGTSGAITCNAGATAFNGRDTIPIIKVECNPLV